MRRIVPPSILCPLIVTDLPCPSKPSIVKPDTVLTTPADPGFILVAYSA